MTENGYGYVTPDQLRIGLYVDLELGWMSHPFPKGSFKIHSQRQIETLRGMRLSRVRYVPARSDPVAEPSQDSTPGTCDAAAAKAVPDACAPDGDHAEEPPQAQQERLKRARHAELIAAQCASLQACDLQFAAAIRQYRDAIDLLDEAPLDASAVCQKLVGALVGDMLGQSESSIRLLSESSGDRAWMHPVNVTVLSLLLGKALGMAVNELHDLGVAAFLHDIGKIRLPDQVRLSDANFALAEYRQYQSHVGLSLAIAQQMQLPVAAQRSIAQHHEMIDGSGFPRQLKGPEIGQAGKVLALVNRYENMCNPPRPSGAVTPHEALSMIFSQMKDRHDITVLAAFIRMMGVYPPGSVVQLSDLRYAMVVSVNSARPLKPRVIVHEPSVPKEEALILDLEQAPASGIRRSIRPDLLPRAAMDYLTPRLRICYFFERAADPVRGEAVS